MHPEFLDLHRQLRDEVEVVVCIGRQAADGQRVLVRIADPGVRFEDIETRGGGVGIIAVAVVGETDGSGVALRVEEVAEAVVFAVVQIVPCRATVGGRTLPGTNDRRAIQVRIKIDIDHRLRLCAQARCGEKDETSGICEVE